MAFVTLNTEMENWIKTRKFNPISTEVGSTFSQVLNYCSMKTPVRIIEFLNPFKGSLLAGMRKEDVEDYYNLLISHPKQLQHSWSASQMKIASKHLSVSELQQLVFDCGSRAEKTALFRHTLEHGSSDDLQKFEKVLGIDMWTILKKLKNLSANIRFHCQEIIVKNACYEDSQLLQASNAHIRLTKLTQHRVKIASSRWTEDMYQEYAKMSTSYAKMLQDWKFHTGVPVLPLSVQHESLKLHSATPPAFFMQLINWLKPHELEEGTVQSVFRHKNADTLVKGYCNAFIDGKVLSANELKKAVDVLVDSRISLNCMTSRIHGSRLLRVTPFSAAFPTEKDFDDCAKLQALTSSSKQFWECESDISIRKLLDLGMLQTPEELQRVQASAAHQRSSRI